MVMFNGINDALDQQNAPRKTDVLLQPQDAQQQTPGQPASGQVQPTQVGDADTAIVTDSGAANKAQASPQAQRSPQQVMDANADVKINNDAASTAEKNANAIVNQQASTLNSYTPKATNNFSSGKDYVEKGGDAPPVKQVADQTPAPIADVTGLQSLGTQFTANPFQGIHNALDKALARKSSDYTDQAKQAQDTIANGQVQLGSLQDAAGVRRQTAIDASTADDAKLADYLQKTGSTLKDAHDINKTTSINKGTFERQNEDIAAEAKQAAIWKAAEDAARAQGKVWVPPPVTRAKLTGNFTKVDDSAYLNPEQFGQQNRLNNLLGIASPAQQVAAPTDLYSNGFDPDAAQRDADAYVASLGNAAPVVGTPGATGDNGGAHWVDNTPAPGTQVFDQMSGKWITVQPK